MTIKEQIAEARQQDFLTVEQLALLTQYAPKSIYRKVSRGEIPGVVRFGGGIRFQRTITLRAFQPRPIPAE